MQIKSGSVCLYRVDTVFWAAPVADPLLRAAPPCVIYNGVAVHFVRSPAVDQKNVETTQYQHFSLITDT